MLTILEGPDCSGKTTLMNRLFPIMGQSRMDPDEQVFHHHFGPPSRSGAFFDYKQWLQGHQHGDGHNVIDRFIYGEPIYSRILNRPSTLGTLTLRMLERVCLSMECVVIACLPKFDTGLQLWQERMSTELLKKPQQYEQSYRLYEELFTNPMGLPRVMYDLETSDPDTILKQAKQQRTAPNQGPGIGNFQSGVTLLVGEEVNEKQATGNWPFVADGGSSMWLTGELEKAGVTEQELYWVNAITHGVPTNPAFVDKLAPGKIIALGKAAEIWCKRNNLPHQAIPHPAFWSRFHNTERYPLHELL